MRRQEFVACPGCGKERPVVAQMQDEDNEALWQSYLRLAAVSSCRACEMDHSRALDQCPETIVVPRGVSTCILGWRHKGRCQPYEMDEAELQELVRRRNDDGGWDPINEER